MAFDFYVVLFLHGPYSSAAVFGDVGDYFRDKERIPKLYESIMYDSHSRGCHSRGFRRSVPLRCGHARGGYI